ncbi:hypothetical protein LG003_21180, partial [Photorhabdus kleinii]|uniref:hypothetical protein n=1 Tax=Photorhabdus kleinii TaxID=768034 RepID=UPI0021D4AF20
SEADVVEVTETAKPAAQNDVVALQSVGDKMDTVPPNCTSLSFAALLRQTPEVGAGCVSSARPDL